LDNRYCCCYGAVGISKRRHSCGKRCNEIPSDCILALHNFRPNALDDDARDCFNYPVAECGIHDSPHIASLVTFFTSSFGHTQGNALCMSDPNQNPFAAYNTAAAAAARPAAPAPVAPAPAAAAAASPAAAPAAVAPAPAPNPGGFVPVRADDFFFRFVVGGVASSSYIGYKRRGEDYPMLHSILFRFFGFHDFG
jgi:hypothetical protein